MNKVKIFNLGIIIGFLITYIEQGTETHATIGELEFKVLFNQGGYESNFSHPLILLPFIGQIFSIVGFYRPRFMLWGALLQLPLVFMITLAGGLSLNLTMISSVILFWISFIFLLREWKATRQKKSHE